jgi:putative PIN family toxin of toxin-antitoxin system
VRVVFDTNTVVSALLFERGRLGWLRTHWQRDDVIALVSRATVDELIRVLTYPKFQLDKADIEALLADYLPYTEPVDVTPRKGSPRCADADDQMFVDLAIAGRAEVLVTGDRALLKMDFATATEDAESYRKRWKQGPGA